MKHLSRGQKRGHAAARARGAISVNRIRACANDGLSIEEAAQRCGLTIGGVRNALYKSTGSTVYPPKDAS